MASASDVSFVLHQPRSLDNVGAVGRVVKNFGLGRLWLVDPLSHSFERAKKLAVGAEDVIDGLFLERDLETALGGFSLAVGTSSREIRGRPCLSPEEMAARIAATPGRCAVVLGDEKRGLSDAELSLCQEVCRIPSAPEQPSLNLAQASAVLAYVVARGAAATAAVFPPVASRAEVSRLRAQAGAILAAADFLKLQNPGRILAELWRPLDRAQLSLREVELWANALKKVGLALGRHSAGQ